MMLISNRDFLRIHYRFLLGELRQYEPIEESKSIMVEPSKKGVPTVKTMVKNRLQYIHSKYDPEAEAEKLANQIDNLSDYNHVLFIGAGLGYHIEIILKQYPTMSFSIYEPNLEMLYHFFSRFPLSSFSNAKLQSIITDVTEKGIKDEIQKLNKSMKTKTLVYTLPSYEKIYINEKIIIMEAFKEHLKNKRNHLATDMQFQRRWAINSIKNLPKVLETPNILHDIDKSVFKNKPAIIVAAGPSLNEELNNLDRIKKKGLAYIFSVGSAINTLVEHNIFPDAACTYDPTERNQFVFKKIKDKNIKEIPLIFGSSVGFETLENYPGKLLHMLTNQDKVAPSFIDKPEEINVVNDAPSIAVITFQMLKMLGFGKVILVGQNLAYLNNSRYAKGISYDFVNNELSEQEKKNLITVKDVYGNETYTNEAFNRMRLQLEMYIDLFTDLQVINTTKGGAHIEGAVFKDLSEIVLDDLQDEKIVIENWFFGKSSYDYNYAVKTNKNLKLAQRQFETIIENLIKVLREIDSRVTKNNSKDLERKFDEFDRKFNTLRKNLYFKVFIEPMLRVHNLRLSEESQAIRFESDIVKKGKAVAHMFAGFLIDCQAHNSFVKPYVKELESKLNELNNN